MGGLVYDIHEVYLVFYTDKNISTTSTLSIAQIQRRTEPRILERNSNSIGQKQIQHQNITK